MTGDQDHDPTDPLQTLQLFDQTCAHQTLLDTQAAGERVRAPGEQHLETRRLGRSDELVGERCRFLNHGDKTLKGVAAPQAQHPATTRANEPAPGLCAPRKRARRVGEWLEHPRAVATGGLGILGVEQPTCAQRALHDVCLRVEWHHTVDRPCPRHRDASVEHQSVDAVEAT